MGYLNVNKSDRTDTLAGKVKAAVPESAGHDRAFRFAVTRVAIPHGTRVHAGHHRDLCQAVVSYSGQGAKVNMACTEHEQVPALVRDIHRIFLKLFNEQIIGLEINQTQWLILNLALTGGIRRVGDIGREVGLESGAATRALDGLEQKGLLCRHRSKTDRRVIDVEITVAGRELVLSGSIKFKIFWHARRDIFNHGDWSELASLLRHLRDILS